MLVYILRRILASIPIVFGVALLTFVLFNFVGGDPVLQMVGKHATVEQIEELRVQYGFDQPKHVQFVKFLKEIVTFDYGRSYATKRPISEMIADGIGPSLTLTIPAFLITTFLSIAISLFVAYFRGRTIDRLVVVLCVFGLSIPMLGYILFGQYYLAYQLSWFPISGFDAGWPERFSYVALPVLLWVLVSLGYEVRFYRTAILEETQQDYVRTARAKGLSEPRVFFKHVLKNSMVPIVTNIVIEIPLLVTGAFLLESFFSIPGVGGITIDAINNSDLPVLKAMTVVISLLTIFGNLLTDIAYTFVDPRVSFK
jgi:peptide/nickel transport system permease protein